MGSLVLVSPQMLVHKNKDDVAEGKKTAMYEYILTTRVNKYSSIQVNKYNSYHDGRATIKREMGG